MNHLDNDQQKFESSIHAIEGEIMNFSAHVQIEITGRLEYMRRVKEMSNILRHQAELGNISWAKAAEEAQEARNAIMLVLRTRSTTAGRAFAVGLKKEGKTLNTLIAEKTLSLFGPGKDFTKLLAAQRNQVYSEIVKSAAKDRPQVIYALRKLSFLGRGLVFVSLALSVYTVMQSTDKVYAAEKEVAVAGAGISGGIAAGALAGIVCGPGAPVCVTIGAFIGGAYAAYKLDQSL